MALVRGGQLAQQRPSEAAQHAALAATPSDGGAAALPLSSGQPDGEGARAAAMQPGSDAAPSQQPRQQARIKGGQARTAGAAAAPAAGVADSPAAAGHARGVTPADGADDSSGGAAMAGRPKRKRSSLHATDAAVAAAATAAGSGGGSPLSQPPLLASWRPSAEPSSGRAAERVGSKVPA